MQGRRNQQVPLAQLNIGRYPVRVCRSLHHCEICGKDITLGQSYRDGGYSRRCHVECAERHGHRTMSEPTDFSASDAFGLLRSYSRHRDYVRLALLHVIQDIERRSLVHDASKMMDDEFSGFARINAIARVNKFGSEEYKASMKQERATIDLHFLRNSHHPERPRLLGDKAEADRGLPDDATYWAARDGARMTFLDVIEMVCDWWGARKGYGDARSWRESVELNFSSKGKFLSAEQLWLAREVAAFLETCGDD